MMSCNLLINFYDFLIMMFIVRHFNITTCSLQFNNIHNNIYYIFLIIYCYKRIATIIISMEKEPVEIIKELGSGTNGTTYLAKFNKQKVAYKIEKYNTFDKKQPLTSEYLRQVHFDTEIAQKHPDNFLTLLDHGIIKNCDFSHATKRDKDYHIYKNKQPNCYYLVMSPILDNSLGYLYEDIFKNMQLYKDMLYQILQALQILDNANYQHRDIGNQNMMYKKTKSKYKWYLIDYGFIWHPSFPHNIGDDYIDNSYFIQAFKTDINCFIYNQIISAKPEIRLFIEKYKIHTPARHIVLKRFKLHPNYKQISRHIHRYINKYMKTNIIINLLILFYPEIYLECLGVRESLRNKYQRNNSFFDLALYCLNNAQINNSKSTINKTSNDKQLSYDIMFKKIEALI